MAMDTIISVQDIRVSLGEIARRAESGESFTVIRNSKPSFRIVPASAGAQEVREPGTQYGSKSATRAPSLEQIRAAFGQGKGRLAPTSTDVERLIAEVRADRRARRPLPPSVGAREPSRRGRARK